MTTFKSLDEAISYAAETFKKGDKVRTIYGEVKTVMRVVGIQIFVYEGYNDWYSPDKIFKI